MNLIIIGAYYLFLLSIIYAHMINCVINKVTKWYDWCTTLSKAELMQIIEKLEKKKKVYSTQYSQAVTHPSTNWARRCLTSVMGRELVLSTWYGRRQRWAIWWPLQSDPLCCSFKIGSWNRFSWHGDIRKYMRCVAATMHTKLSNSERKWFVEKFDKNEKSTAPSIPRRSPIQVLTGLDVA